jgi:hypothetical protein
MNLTRINAAISFLSAGSGGVISVTHAELTALITNSTVVIGQWYKITDYATKHVVNDSTNTATATIHTEDVEPLLVLGIAINKIHKQVYSEQYPNDIIYYDITNVLCEDSSTARKGIITYRKDEWENETHFDFRGTKVYNGANNVYIFANSRNPGSLSFYGNKIGINNTYNNYFLFGDECYSNVFGDFCYSNTLGDNCYSNILGDACDSNTLGDGCDSNTFGNGCGSNTLGNNCNSNTLGNDCYSNTLGNDCYSNTLGDACNSNILGDACNSNILGDGCGSIVPDTGNTAAILNTTFENGVSNITYLATATHLYAAYHKTVFLYPDGTKKLRYFDNSGVLQVVDVND